MIRSSREFESVLTYALRCWSCHYLQVNVPKNLSTLHIKSYVNETNTNQIKSNYIEELNLKQKVMEFALPGRRGDASD